MENRVKFKIGEIEFEAEGTEELIERERGVFLNSILPAAIEAVVKTRVVENVNDSYMSSVEATPQAIEFKEVDCVKTKEEIDLSRMSLVTFLKQYGSLNDQDFVLFSAYYDEKKNNIKSFSSESVKKYYAEARRTEYSNVRVLLRNLVKKGLIMDNPNVEQKTPKTYIITGEGLTYIDEYVPKTENDDKKRSHKPKKKRVKTESVYASVSADELNLRKYPEIKSFSNFKDQMMLIMYICSTENIGNAFTAQDIECLLTDILGLHATNNQVQGIFKRNKIWFKDEADQNNPKMVRHVLLEGGKDYAKSLIKAEQN